jgi:hypothetical protein
VLSQSVLTPALFQALTTGIHLGEVDVLGYAPNSVGVKTLVTDDSFGLVFASDLSVGNSGATSVTLKYGSESLSTTTLSPTGGGTTTKSAWNQVTNTNFFSTSGTSPTTPVAAPTTLQGQTISPAASPNVTYYVRFTPISGSLGGPLDGKTLYQLSSFSFADQNAVTIGSVTGAGKTVLDPLNLVLSQSVLTAALLQELTTGTHLQEVDVLGYALGAGPGGTPVRTLATDDSFAPLFASDLSVDSSGATSVTLQYGSESLSTTPLSPTGVSGTPITHAWDQVTNTAGFSGIPLTAPKTLTGQTISPAVSPNVTYYVRFTLAGTSSGPLDGKTLYQLSSFSFADQNAVSIGSAGGGRRSRQGRPRSAEPGADPVGADPGIVPGPHCRHPSPGSRRSGLRAGGRAGRAGQNAGHR